MESQKVATSAPGLRRLQGLVRVRGQTSVSGLHAFNLDLEFGSRSRSASFNNAHSHNVFFVSTPKRP